MAPSTDNATANAALAREDGVSDDDDYHYDDISDESSFYGQLSKVDFIHTDPSHSIFVQ